MIKKYLNIILLIFIIVLIVIEYLIFGYLFYFYDKDYKKLESDVVNNDIMLLDTRNNEDNFFVEVKGAVNNPGVYEMKNNNIINDLINAAGGFKNNAYTNNINLSKNLSSQMVVFVYTKYEYSKINNKNNINECNCSSYDISKCLDEGRSIINNNDDIKSDNIATNNESDNKDKTNIININSASLSELMNLPGIGESKARNIIEYREKNGLFSDISDIKNVSGISEKIFESIKEYITI